MANELLRRLLIDEEGFDTKAHKVKGIWHIGIGHNLEIEQTPDELFAMGLPADWDYMKTDIPVDTLEITEEQAYALFDIDVDDAIHDVARSFSLTELDALDEARRAVILSMVFQLGGAGLRKFFNFIASVKVGDYKQASLDMMDSLAARQTPQRWERASFAMREGYFESYQPQPVEVPEPIGLLSEITTDELLAELKRRIEG